MLDTLGTSKVLIKIVLTTKIPLLTSGIKYRDLSKYTTDKNKIQTHVNKKLKKFLNIWLVE